jgi:MFS family permease
MAPAHDPYAALRLRDYRLLLSGGVLASVGTSALAVVVGWEVFERTNESYFALALAGLAQFFPVLLLALPAGQAADRYSRKVLAQIAQGGLALTCLALASLSFWQGPVELIFVCLLLAGACRALYMPTRSALLPQLVPTEVLANAVTWNSTGWQIASITGPALAGGVMVLFGYAATYLLSACCCLGCVVLLLPIRPRPVPWLLQPRTLGSLLAGLRFVWRTELLLAAITLDLFAVLLGGATALLPAYAKLLGVGKFGLGALRAAPALGALLMGVALAHLPPLRRAGLALLSAVAGFGAATIGFGLSTHFGLSFLFLALTGALDNVSMVVRGTLMQLLTPDEMRGRVSAVNSVFISSSNELGEFESGAVAAVFGPVVSVVGGGIGTILVVAAVALRWPKLLRLRELHSVALHPSSENGEAEAAQPEASRQEG